MRLHKSNLTRFLSFLFVFPLQLSSSLAAIPSRHAARTEHNIQEDLPQMCYQATCLLFHHMPDYLTFFLISIDQMDP